MCIKKFKESWTKTEWLNEWVKHETAQSLNVKKRTAVKNVQDWHRKTETDTYRKAEWQTEAGRLTENLLDCSWFQSLSCFTCNCLRYEKCFRVYWKTDTTLSCGLSIIIIRNAVKYFNVSWRAASNWMAAFII